LEISRKVDAIVVAAIVKSLMLWWKLQLKTFLNFLVTPYEDAVTINMW